MADVDLLREAAALMRKRAEAASPSGEGYYAGGWHGYSLADDGTDGRAEMFCGPVVDGYRTGAVFSFADWNDCQECTRPSGADVAHIASWHPDVALAVADWLDHEAGACGCTRSPFVEAGHALAHTLARAYLGRDS